MIHGHERRLRRVPGVDGAPFPSIGSRHSGSPDDRTAVSAGPRAGPAEALARAAAAPPYALMQGLMSIAAAVCFRRIQVANRGRFPGHGPAVVIANHPAAWTDVIVLDVAFGRKLHFLAHETLFRPRSRGALLRLYGALPVYFRHETPDGTARNRATFARCRTLLERGEVIAVFPEGVSEDVPVLLPLKTGAARLILGSAAGDAWPVVPVAIRYEDRCAFRDRVTLAVGEPVSATPYLSRRDSDPDSAAHAFTAAMARALERAMADADARAAVPDSARPRPEGAPLAALVAVLGVAGRIAHAPVVAVIEACVHRCMGQPQRLALGRIALGLVLLPAWYATIAAVALGLNAGPWLAAVFVVPVLGGFACMDSDRRRAAARVRREARS
jgi:1-acyl-sn-glycerol-3-phosphate acyltransferase